MVSFLHPTILNPLVAGDLLIRACNLTLLSRFFLWAAGALSVQWSPLPAARHLSYPISALLIRSLGKLTLFRYGNYSRDTGFWS